MNRRYVYVVLVIVNLIVQKKNIIAVDVNKMEELTDNQSVKNVDMTRANKQDSVEFSSDTSEQVTDITDRQRSESWTYISKKVSFIPSVTNQQVRNVNKSTAIENNNYIKQTIIPEIPIPHDGSSISAQGVSDAPKQDICSQYGGCDLADAPYWYCKCDELCEEYNDCCQGHNLTEDKRSDVDYNCMVIDESKEILWGIQTISNCPPSYQSDTDIRKCTHGHIRNTGPPVFDLHNKSRVYRNKYCALCHGISVSSMDVVFSTDQDYYNDIDQLSKMNDFKFQEFLFNISSYRLVIPEDVNVRYCISGLVQNEDYLCNRYSNPIYYDAEQKFYRNNLCRDIADKSFPLCIKEFMDLLSENSGYDYFFDFPKLSILFSFTETKSQIDKRECREWKKEIDKDCEHLPRYANAEIDIDINIMLPENTSSIEMTQAALLTMFVKSVNGLTDVSPIHTIAVGEKFKSMRVKDVKCTILKTVFSHELANIIKKVNNQKVSIVEIDNEDRRFNSVNQKYTHEEDNMTTMTNWYFNTGTMESYFVDFGITIPDIAIKTLCNDVEILVLRRGILSLHVISINCKTKSLVKYKFPFLSVLTFILSGVSSLSLVIMIIINRRHHVHIEIPFANLENLGISIVLSNLLLMIGTVATYKHDWMCYAVSVTSHYLWLAVFSFTSLAVLHIVKSLMQLKSRRIQTKETRTRKRRTMTGIGLVIPLLFVGPALVVDQYGPNYYSPGYANDDVCFPIKFPGNLIFFTGPVLASIAINTFSIVQVIVRIHMAIISKGNLRQSSTFSEAKIFLRILSISGCFWITGILAAYFESEWLDYIFTLLCGSQGLFVAVANLTTKRMNCCKRSREQTSIRSLSVQ